MLKKMPTGIFFIILESINRIKAAAAFAVARVPAQAGLTEVTAPITSCFCEKRPESKRVFVNWQRKK